MKKHILLIEDSPMDLHLFQRAVDEIAEFDIALHTAEGVEEALRILEASLSPPQLVLCDVLLIGKQGADLVKLIRKHPNPRIAVLPIIMLSNSHDPEEQHRCLALGANVFLEKAPSYQQFTAQLKDTFRFWLHWAIQPDPSLHGGL